MTSSKANSDGASSTIVPSSCLIRHFVFKPTLLFRSKARPDSAVAWAWNL
jgi:hypothetical protein